MSVAGLATATWIQLRTGWKVVVAWVVVLGATMLGTTLSISGLYDTPAKIDSYARASGNTPALEMINGHVYGIDTVGGVIANEFGFIASFALPLMGISIIARATRRDEDAGRLTMLVAGRVGRSAPLVSAVLVTTAAVLITATTLAAGLVSGGVDVSDSLLYAAALGALALVFAGIATVTAQLVDHARGVYTISVGVLVGAYLLRGAGAVLDNGLTWLSPLGWVQEARAFADARWWPVLLSLVIAGLLMTVAATVNAKRDLGSAWFRRTSGAATATAFLQSRFGFALRLHRGAIVSWVIAVIVVEAAFGALAQAVIDAMEGNEALQGVLGGTGEAGAGGFLSMAVLMLALLCSAYVIQDIGTLGSEESTGRLAFTLAAPIRRRRWLALHLLVVVIGLLVVTVLGTLVLGLATIWSTGQDGLFGDVVKAAASYVPAVTVLAGVAFVLFAMLPRLFGLAWLVLAFAAVDAFLGETLSFPEWLRSLAPLEHVGYPPQDTADGAALAALTAVAVVLCVAGFEAFRRRDIQ